MLDRLAFPSGVHWLVLNRGMLSDNPYRLEFSLESRKRIISDEIRRIISENGMQIDGIVAFLSLVTTHLNTLTLEFRHGSLYGLAISQRIDSDDRSYCTIIFLSFVR